MTSRDMGTLQPLSFVNCVELLLLEVQNTDCTLIPNPVDWWEVAWIVSNFNKTHLISVHLFLSSLCPPPLAHLSLSLSPPTLSLCPPCLALEKPVKKTVKKLVNKRSCHYHFIHPALLRNRDRPPSKQWPEVIVSKNHHQKSSLSFVIIFFHPLHLILRMQMPLVFSSLFSGSWWCSL